MNPRSQRLTAVLLAAAMCLLLMPRVARAQDEPPAMQGGEQMGVTPFTIQGFGDVNYVARAREGEPTGFVNGAFDLFATSRLGEHWSALAELVFESNNNELSTDLERFQFTYEHSDALRISAGRVHNPLLQWPVLFHHGLFNQTPIDRPIIARWEDEPGLWPMHFVGVLGQGRFGGAWGPSYSIGVGNGRGHVLDEVLVSGDENKQRAVVAAFGVRPERVAGLMLNVSGYADEIPAERGKLRERDVALSGSFVRSDAEVRAEWSRMSHTLIDRGRQFVTTGWYVLAAYRLPEEYGRIKPYVLIEGLDVPAGERFFEGALSEHAWAAGVRWDANRWVALKADFRSRKLEGTDRFGAARAQIAVNF